MTTNTTLPNSVAMQLSYKKYTDPNIYPGTSPAPATDPGTAGAQQLRRISSSLSPVKATFKANELRADQQMVTFRHGARKMTGDIAGDLSPKTYQDFFAAVVRGNWANGVSASQVQFTSITATNSTSKLTVNVSTWAAQGFMTGDVIRLNNVVAANQGVNFTILALSGVDATVYPAPTDMTADTTFTVTVVGRKVQPPTTAPIKTKWAFEQYYTDAGIAHLFTECRLSAAKVTVPSNDVASVTFTVMGRDMALYESGSSPFFVAPTAPTDTEAVASFGGCMVAGGVPIAVLTNAALTIDIKASTVDAAFNTLTPEIFTGVLDVSGTATALFQDDTLLGDFLNETEIAMSLLLTTLNSPSADFVSFFMSRVKLTSHNFANSGEQGIPITVGFQAIKKPVTTGFDPATIVIQDSLSA